MADDAERKNTLGTQLVEAVRTGAHDTVATTSEELMRLDAKDEEASHCLLVSLLHMTRFDEALSLLRRMPKLANDHPFEHAYCLYKNDELEQAMRVLQTALKTSDDPGTFHLEAQLAYRLQNFDTAIDLYQRLLSEAPKGEDTRELLCNLSAAYTTAGRASKGLAKLKSSVKDANYELLYNMACAYIETNDWIKAKETLEKALALALDSMLKDGVSEEEIADETAIIRAQLAYIEQAQGHEEEPMASYTSILKAKPSDSAVAAVVASNMIALRGDKDLFDSSKKAKTLVSEGVEKKLTMRQQQAIALNRALLLMLMNKGDNCRTLISKMEKDYPGSELPVLLRTALLHREKKSDQEMKGLEEFIRTCPGKALKSQLTVAQMRMERGDMKGAIEQLESIQTLQQRPGVVATLVALYEKLGDTEGASRTFDKAVAWWDTRMVGEDDAALKTLLREGAAFKMRHGYYKDAAALYEKLVQRERDPETLAGLVFAYSEFDPELAERYASKLPTLAGVESVNAESLENLAVPRSLEREPRQALDRSLKRTAAEEGDGMQVKEHKKKKKKKLRLPKDFDPKVKPDPERWMPLKDRSYYKRSRRRGERTRGTQGAVNVAEKEKEKSTAPEKPPQPQLPQQTSSIGIRNKKKKGRR